MSRWIAIALTTLLTTAPAAADSARLTAEGVPVDPFLVPAEPDPLTLAGLSKQQRRRTMLKWHQGLALTALGLLTAQTVVGQLYWADPTNGSLRDVHRALGFATFGSYAIAAPLAIFAPAGHTPAGFDAMAIHRRLALVHGTGMALLPILGLYTADRRSQAGVDPITINRLRTAHLATGYVTWAAMAGAALVIVLD